MAIEQMYSLYVNNFDRAREHLAKLENDCPSFAAFLSACERQKPCRGLRLRDFLILPVQVGKGINKQEGGGAGGWRGLNCRAVGVVKGYLFFSSQ